MAAARFPAPTIYPSRVPWPAGELLCGARSRRVAPYRELSVFSESSFAGSAAPMVAKTTSWRSRIRGGVAHRLSRMRGLVVGSVRRVRTCGEHVAALTFDDGPDPAWTPRVLELLGRFGARATFFMIGQNALRHPDLVEAVASAGHVIGNHTLDHVEMPAISPGRQREQLRGCSRVLGRYESPLFRPPKGLQSPASFALARLMGYQVVVWSTEIEDWRASDADTLESMLMGRIYPGCIMGLHDTLWEPSVPAARDRTPLLRALESALSRLVPAYEFVTIPDLLCAGEVIRVPWFIRTEADWTQFVAH